MLDDKQKHTYSQTLEEGGILLLSPLEEVGDEEGKNIAAAYDEMARQL